MAPYTPGEARALIAGIAGMQPDEVAAFAVAVVDERGGLHTIGPGCDLPADRIDLLLHAAGAEARKALGGGT